MNKINTLSIFLLCSAIQILSSEELGHKELSRANLYDSIIKKHPDSECRQKCELVWGDLCFACVVTTCLALECARCDAETSVKRILPSSHETLLNYGMLGAIPPGVLFCSIATRSSLNKIAEFDEYKRTKATQELQKMK